ncbi:GGDEF domain-containing protein [Psychromonas sp. MB-3u-54]|nr:GGDEF domain-containing protein [Psychromonas sp. MB-3u-54]
MGCLITLFVLGYLAYANLFWEQHTQAADLIVPGVFFFGACFVLLSTFLSLNTGLDIIRICELEKESSTDPLTGVYNRRHMDKCLQEEIAKAQRYKFDLSLLLIDLDNFKLINDQHGHQVGDQVLTEMSALVVQELRSFDVMARYGGEEFLVIAPNTGPEYTHILAERLRKKIETHHFIAASKALEIKLTISIGGASYGGSITSQESLVLRADNNLYLAKGQGRNKVITDQSKDSP